MRPAIRHVLLALCAAIGLALGVAVVATPGWLAQRIQAGLIERAARRGIGLEIGAVYLSPLSQVTLDGLVLRDLGLGADPTATSAQEANNGAPFARIASAPFARIARVQVEFEWNGVLSPRLWLRKVTVAAPQVTVVRGVDGKFALEATLRRLLTARDKDDDAGPGGGLRKYLSKHLPDLEIRSLSATFDDASRTTPARLGGVDLARLRLTDATLTVRNASPVQEKADLRLEATARVQGVAQPILLSGEARWPEREGELQLRLPGDMAVEMAGWRVSVASVTAHSDGRVALGRVQVAQVGAAGQMGLDVQEIVAHVRALPGPVLVLPPEIQGKLPGPVLQALRHVEQVAVHEPVLIGQRQVVAAVPGEEGDDDEVPETPLAPDQQPGGKDAARGKANANKVNAGKALQAAKDLALKQKLAAEKKAGVKNPEAGDGRIVRDNLADVFTRGADRLQRQFDRLRTALAAIPIPVVTVHNGRARYSDELQGPARELSDFNVRIERKPGDDAVSLQLEFHVPGAAGKTNAIKARVDTRTGDADVDLQLEQLNLAPYAAVLPASLTVGPTSAIRDTAVHLEYRAAPGTMAIDGRLTVAQVHVDVRRISRQRLQNLTVTGTGKVLLDLKKEELQLQGGELQVGKVSVLLTSSVKRFRTAPAFDLQLKIPTVACQDAVDSVPVGFATMLEGMRCHGQMSFEVKGALDTANMNSLQFDFDAALAEVEITSTGKYIRFDIFGAPFEHHARQKDGSLFTFVTGPGSDRWVPLQGVSPNIIKVLTTTEDGGFFGHKGFSLDSIRSAMVENLKRGRFVRGASTITQQLVKNLFFVEREKTIARKVQEAVITWQIERSLSKQDMMGLYLNIIEFGPRLYGIKAATQHYFNRPPAELTLLQSLWLGSIIPNPRGFYHQFSKGTVGDSWKTYLCWIAATMLTREKITADEFRRLGGCTVVFGGGLDGSEEPPLTGLGHEGDPALGEPLADPTRAERPAPSVGPDDQP